MDNQQFSTLIKQACEQGNLPAVLSFFKQCNDDEIVSAAEALSGQFALAEVEGERRIYHVSVEMNDAGDETEYVEHIMNEGDESILFVAWFFESQFDMKRKEIYLAAGKTYKQPKRS